MTDRIRNHGARVGSALLWLVGVPVPAALTLYLLFNCCTAASWPPVGRPLAEVPALGAAPGDGVRDIALR
jgi:hypothetical protein